MCLETQWYHMLRCHQPTEHLTNSHTRSNKESGLLLHFDAWLGSSNFLTWLIVSSFPSLPFWPADWWYLNDFSIVKVNILNGSLTSNIANTSTSTFCNIELWYSPTQSSPSLSSSVTISPPTSVFSHWWHLHDGVQGRLAFLHEHRDVAAQALFWQDQMTVIHTISRGLSAIRHPWLHRISTVGTGPWAYTLAFPFWNKMMILSRGCGVKIIVMWDNDREFSDRPLVSVCLTVEVESPRMSSLHIVH